MIETWTRRWLPDWWNRLPAEDPRFDGLVHLSGVICDAFEFANGDSDDDLVPTPLELAHLLREAADRIEFSTGDFGHGPGNTMT